MFIDWSQNSRHKTTICAYSLRARPAPDGVDAGHVGRGRGGRRRRAAVVRGRRRARARRRARRPLRRRRSRSSSGFLPRDCGGAGRAAGGRAVGVGAPGTAPSGVPGTPLCGAPASSSSGRLADPLVRTSAGVVAASFPHCAARALGLGERVAGCSDRGTSSPRRRIGWNVTSTIAVCGGGPTGGGSRRGAGPVLDGAPGFREPELPEGVGRRRLPASP